MLELLDRINIIAIGVSHVLSDFIPIIRGVENDIENFQKLFIENPKTALFSRNQFIKAYNINSKEFRSLINDYILGRSIERDILIFYFSGHGLQIGLYDFGFCTTDTIIHPEHNIALPLSVVKFSELLQTIEIANIIPIFIIDACFSGKIANDLVYSPVQAISNIHNQIHSKAASSYALLCSCSDSQSSYDTREGGIFSKSLFYIGERGFNRKEKNKPILSLQDISTHIESIVTTETTDSTPRLFIGPTLQEFPMFKNAQYKPRKFRLSPTLIQVITALWNNGNQLILSPKEIGEKCSPGAYCNHNKLSMKPWNLVDTVPNTLNRRLTKTGVDFIQNTVTVPKTIEEDINTGEMKPSDGTKYVTYSDFLS